MLMPVAFVALMGLRTVQHLAAGHFGDLRKTVGDTVNQQVERIAGLAQGVGVQLETEELRANATDVAQDAIRQVASHLGDMAAVAPQLLVSIFLLLFALYFFLADGPRMVHWVGTVVPFSRDETLELFGSVRQAIRGVVLSSMLVGLLQSAMCLGAMLIFSVPGAFVWSVMAFVLSFLPMVGTTPVTLGCVVYLALGDRWWAAAVMAVAAVIHRYHRQLGPTPGAGLAEQNASFAHPDGDLWWARNHGTRGDLLGAGGGGCGAVGCGDLRRVARAPCHHLTYRCGGRDRVCRPGATDARNWRTGLSRCCVGYCAVPQ